MSSTSLLLLLLSLLVFESSSIQQVSFGGNNGKKLGEVITTGNEAYARNPISTNQITNPWIKPWVKVFDMVKQDTKEFEFADKVEKESQEDSVSSSRSIFDLFKPARRMESNIKPKPVMQHLFDPFDLHRFGSTTAFATPISPKNNLFANDLLLSKSKTPQNAIHINSLAKNATLIRQTEPLRGFVDRKPIQLDNLFLPNPPMIFSTIPIARKYSAIAKLAKFKSPRYEISQMHTLKLFPSLDPLHQCRKT